MPDANVKFETLKAKDIKFGRNNFLEVARKKAITPDSDKEFLAITRGFYTPDGMKKFKKSIAVPLDKEVVEFVIKCLQEFR